MRGRERGWEAGGEGWGTGEEMKRGGAGERSREGKGRRRRRGGEERGKREGDMTHFKPEL